MFSKENFEKYKDLHESFMVKLNEVLNLKVNIEEGMAYYKGEIQQVEFYGKKIDITTYEDSNCSCCSGEHHCYTIPESYLYDESWVEELKKEVEEKKEKARLKKEEEERQCKIKEEQRELEQYEKLKKKFEQK